MATDEPAKALAPTVRSTLRRLRQRGSHERAVIDAILDEALVCHVGFAGEHGPVVLPMAYARIGDDLYLHGAAGNAMLRTLASGVDVCVTVTLLDGVVLARSAFHHSMNYRCVVVFGRAVRVEDPAEAQRASAALVDHLVAGRSDEVRAPTDEELRKTLLVRLAIEEGSAKVRTGGPADDADDLSLPVWAGVLPLRLRAGDAEADAGVEVATPHSVAAHPLRA